MKRVILRVDDVCGATDAADLEQFAEPCWARSIPLCLSVVPRSAYRFAADGPLPMLPIGVSENRALCALLATRVRTGLAEVTLHGWQHHPGELARGTPAEIGAQLAAGLTELRRALPGVTVRVLVPPHDHLSRAGLAAARALGLGVCSTWAATHGGTRAVHWWGRLRRWCGRPFAPARGGCWPTDVCLAFDKPEADERQRTERLLALAERWGSPVVIVLHPWQLPEDRWRQWLEWLAARPDVQFGRFCDGE